ncbi:MAG: DinB family protein [Armatimonadetes bacterium]|nr:DinB family protein [Armatimonadota bacterium]
METSTNNAVASVLTGIVQECGYLYGRDIEASTDDICTCTQEGKSRSVLAMTAEVIGFNHLVASLLRGESKGFPTPEERDAFAASISSKDIAKAKLDASVADVCSAIEGVSMDDWMTKITAPWGMEVTKAHLCSWSALHMSYHDGQVNLVQILNGDHEVHWMS